MRKVLLIFLLILAQNNFAQQIRLSEDAQISMITIEPGKYLVDTFGHSAIRVKDDRLGIDQAYNYGTYDFNKPNFYLNFAKGKLEYDLSSYPFIYLLRGYKRENRSITEQVLHISQQDKQRFFEFLENNAKPENKTYLYDFLYDNCATKLPEVSAQILDKKLQLNYDFASGQELTFRDLIHLYLDEQPWGKFGIDLALGSVIDVRAKPQEYVFLPDYVFKSFEKATITNSETSKPLVSKTNVLFQSTPKEEQKFYFTPVVFFTILALLVLWITFKDHRRHKRTKLLDFLLFFSTGIVGMLMLLLWLTTDHHATAKNYNVLWAFAPNLIVAFYFLKNELKPWIKYYLVLLLLLLVLAIVIWIFQIQIFSIAVIPIMILLVLRYVYLFSNFQSVQ